MSTTPTGYQNGQQPPRRQSTTDHQNSNAPFSTQQEDPNTRYPPNPAYQQQPQPYSRPSSGLSGNGYSQTYQEQNQRQAHGNEKAQSSVVIKVGMVGDAQIGKTSLMVKYVEGSWDEDYIQTLGMNFQLYRYPPADGIQVSISWKRLSRYGTRRLHSQSGISAASANS